MKLACIAMALLGAVSASAAPIDIGIWYMGGWFNGAGSTVGGCLAGCPFVESGQTFHHPGDGPWTFVAPAGGVILTVTDVEIDGDNFNILDGGNPLGSTNGINSTGANCGIDGVACLADPRFSHGTFALGAGAHSLSMVVAAQTNGFSDGSVAFRLDNAVPEPSAFGLMFLGLAGLAAAARKRAQ